MSETTQIYLPFGNGSEEADNGFYGAFNYTHSLLYEFNVIDVFILEINYVSQSNRTHRKNSAW